jgi:excinuclease ABC subunit A
MPAIKEKKVSASAKSFSTDIFIKNARTHNLKNVSVSIPRNKFIVVTGVSGSGKSSLTIDTLFAEGQRKYAESLSAYARQFMARMVKPDVDDIKGLCPAIAIEQKVVTRTPRSTVGSMTEIYDYLRLLFARIGVTISPVSGNIVKKDDVKDVIDHIQSLKKGSKVIILIAFKQHPHREIKEELNILVQKGFSRICLTNPAKLETFEVHRIEELLEDEKKLNEIFNTFKKISKQPSDKKKNTLMTLPNTYVVVDRIVTKEFEEDDLHRLSDSISTAFYEGEGKVYLEIDGATIKHFSIKFELDGIKFEEPVPNLFSFNNPYGACPTCEGFSQVLGIDADLVIPNRNLSVYEGAIAPWKGEKLGWWREQFIKGTKDFPIHKPICELTKEQEKQLWTGVDRAYGINDFFKEVEQNLYKVQYRVLQSRYRGRTVCYECEGYRLRKEALYVKINEKHIGELCIMQVKDVQTWFSQITLTANEKDIAKRLLLEIEQRIKTLIDVGLGYLTLNRLANSLSGGESQRIQLTRSLGSNLTDSLYILDEPSIGLHNRDTEKLIGVLKSLKALGNTVVVVEHDELMMREADYIIDMGPLASHLGGEVVATGNYQEIISNKNSLTGKYLTGELKIEPPKNIRKAVRRITIEGATQNNLKNITVNFPLGVLCVISGVSGSGKTTLVKQILYPALQKLKGEGADKVGNHKTISGDVSFIDAIEMIDQNPIGKSSRSNPVTYIKAYDEIRELFAAQPLSKIRGFLPKHFSFNVEGGRCDTCSGEGEQVVEMQFLADVHLTCETCGGKRFKEEVIDVTYNNKNIDDVLNMSVDEAIKFFEAHTSSKKCASALKPLQDVGLGYIKLGQSASTLSGGEAQRVKLASFLGKGKGNGHILFIFDEPTTGLHFHDIQKLLQSFNALVEQGHSLLVIEHNTDVIKCADWLIELGPEAGDLGGNLVFAGVPKDIKKVKESWTGKFM